MNSLAKTLLIGGGVVFVAIAGCTTLSIGGCATAIGIAAWKTSNLPEYASASALSEKHGPDFEKIKEALENKISLKYSDERVSLNEDILAIIAEVNGSDVDIYEKFEASLNGYAASNNAGTGTLNINDESQECLIYIIEWNDNGYYVCIRDTFADPTSNE